MLMLDDYYCVISLGVDDIVCLLVECGLFWLCIVIVFCVWFNWVLVMMKVCG